MKILFYLAIILFSTTSLHTQTLAVANVNILPMDVERILEDHTILIKGDTIFKIGSSSSVLIPKGSKVIDGKGLFLMPGLADMHVHLRNAEELLSYLAYGVTSVMHMGGSSSQGNRNLLYHQEVNKGTRIGPNIYTTGRIFDGDPRASNRAYEISETKLARELVMETKKAGFDFIKIYNNISLPVFEAIVAQADEIGLPVVGHLSRKFDPLISLGQGQSMVVHAEEFFFTYFKGPRSTSNIDKDYKPDLSLIPELIDHMKLNNITVIPNLSYAYADFEMWDDLGSMFLDPEMAYVSPSIIQNEFHSGNLNRRSNIENFIYRDQIKYTLSQELTREFQKAGILQLLGTDATQAGIFPGKSAHRELRELVKAGLSNFETLSIATANAGLYAQNNMPDKGNFGQIKEGFRADLVLLKKNPLEDVRNAQLIKGVMVSGQWIDIKEIDSIRGLISDKYKELKHIRLVLEKSLEYDTTEKDMAVLIKKVGQNHEYLRAIESKINGLGYASLSKNSMKEALHLFELNTKYFPESANVWDSYAEAYLEIGDNKNAVKYYQMALAINPELSSARNQLKIIQKE